jgi:hypothetical protein
MSPTGDAAEKRTLNQFMIFKIILCRKTILQLYVSCHAELQTRLINVVISTGADWIQSIHSFISSPLFSFADLLSFLFLIFSQ